MPLNDVKRVIFNKNPLIQVVCQLSFPRILSINERAPTDFQERIRKNYPIYNVGVDQQQQIIIEPGVDASPKIVQNEQFNNYSFTSDDGIWQINLGSTFLALSTSKYKKWEDFRTRLQEPLDALKNIYSPAFYERIGLRYVDAISRSALGIDITTPWTELLQPFALGFLSNNDIADEILGHSATSEINIGNNAVARVVTSTGFVGDIIYQKNPELSFIIDSDLSFNVRKNLDELDAALEYLHEYSSRLIHSIITEKLHHAMEPKEL